MIIARRLLRQILLVLICVRAVAGAEHLSPLGKSPNWSDFEKYQETLTHDEFMAALQNVYCTRGLPNEFIQVEGVLNIVGKCGHARLLLHSGSATLDRA